MPQTLSFIFVSSKEIGTVDPQGLWEYLDRPFIGTHGFRSAFRHSRNQRERTLVFASHKIPVNETRIGLSVNSLRKSGFDPDH
jgi:hypothetical protein